jgi:hypothetical protein
MMWDPVHEYTYPMKAEENIRIPKGFSVGWGRVM